MDDRLLGLMSEMVERNASDLHLTAGSRPYYRVFGQLEPTDVEVESPADLQALIYSILNEEQQKRLEQDKELDCSVGIAGEGRFRVNVFYQRGSVAAAIRRLPYDIPSFEELGLPVHIMKSLCHKPRGMVLVTGPTGSGKSTTLAAMIDYINQTSANRIICVEDPIEYLHGHKESLVSQRELGQDTHSFADALRHVLRQDPDVVQIGEMRDLETIRSMLTVAETGHLAFSTLHTSTAPTTINRIVDVFPHEQQEQVRVQLSFELEAVVSQQLLPARDGKGVVLAYETMIVNPAIRNLIREGEIDQIYSQMQIGGGTGMVTMNASLAELVLAGRINEDTAKSKCSDVKELTRLLEHRASMEV